MYITWHLIHFNNKRFSWQRDIYSWQHPKSTSKMIRWWEPKDFYMDFPSNVAKLASEQKHALTLTDGSRLSKMWTSRTLESRLSNFTENIDRSFKIPASQKTLSDILSWLKMNVPGIQRNLGWLCRQPAVSVISPALEGACSALPVYSGHRYPSQVSDGVEG